MSEWYKSWFNTPEYLNVYRHRNDADAKLLAALIFSNLKIKPGSAVLDMACGTGRHSVIFAREGMEVTAVDLSENLLAVAKSSAERAGVLISYINADLRHFYLEKKFDLALNLFTSFGYFESDEENFMVFKQAYDHLRPGGRFVFDFFNSGHLRRNLIAGNSDIIEGMKFEISRRIRNKRVEKTIRILRDGENIEYLESVKMYESSEIVQAMEANGFKITKIFGDFRGSEFNEKESPRLIIFAEK